MDNQTPSPSQPHPGGRPTKYDSKFIDAVDIYIIETLEKGNKLPTNAGFANYIGVDKDTINAWANEKTKDAEGNRTKKRVNPEFFRAIKRLKTVQEAKLINDGLYGGRNVNSIMAIFLLKVNHGMVEMTKTDITSKGEQVSQVVGFNLLPPATENLIQGDGTDNTDNQTNS